jgi:hypothetical protein
MINKPKLIPTSLVLLFTTFGQTLFGGSPPSSLEGYKMTIDVVEIDGNEFTTSFYFLPNGVRLADDWEQGAYTWSRYGSTGTILMEQYSDGKFEILLNFSNNTLQGKETSGSTSKIVVSGTFTLENYSDDDLPYGKFFHDDFTNASESEYIWGNYSKDGFSAKIHEGGYTMYGNMTEDGNRWGQEIGARSLLGLDKDWYVQGTAFSENGERIEVSIECDMDAKFQLEVHVSTDGYGVNSSIQYERYDQGDDYAEQSLNDYASSAVFNERKDATLRIRNSANENTFHIEWLDGTEWQNLNSLNWKTGTLAQEASSGWNQSSNTQFHDWESMENYFFNPQMEFGVPDSLTVNLGDYGFTSFSVIEGAPEPEPEYAPSSLAGKIYQGTMNDVYQFIDETNAIFYHQESNFQNSEVSNITYTWSASGNSGTLTTTLDETTTLSFTSEAEGTFQWQENGGTSNSGSFTLVDASSGYAPNSLAGDSIIAGSTTYVFKDNGAVTIKSASGSEESTYGFIKSEDNVGVLTIPAYDDGENRMVLKLTYSSTATGTLTEGGSGSFNYYADGQDMPATKGWMWFDHYPWVYSHVEGGWLYFLPSGSKLMVYSVKDEAWREMTE